MTRGGTQDEMRSYKGLLQKQVETGETGGWDTGRGGGCRRGWWLSSVTEGATEKQGNYVILWKFGGWGWAGDRVKT